MFKWSSNEIGFVKLEGNQWKAFFKIRRAYFIFIIICFLRHRRISYVRYPFVICIQAIISNKYMGHTFWNHGDFVRKTNALSRSISNYFQWLAKYRSFSFLKKGSDLVGYCLLSSSLQENFRQYMGKRPHNLIVALCIGNILLYFRVVILKIFTNSLDS